MPGSLTVVGTGIRVGLQLTPEARDAVIGADDVLYLVADPAARAWIESLRADARSLHRHYEPGESRRETTRRSWTRSSAVVAGGRNVCASPSTAIPACS